MTQDEAKLAVARRAVEFVEEGMAVGLGTGTTATMFIRELGKRVKAGLKIRCVASSDASHDLGVSLGMDVVSLAELPELDIYIDGADEVCAGIGSGAGIGLGLIKGGGGALLREKIVASSAKRFIVVVDSSKVVGVLGKFPLPVEVIEMALPLVTRKLTELGLHLDCACGAIPEPEKTAAAIRGVVGVVEHGLFLGMATLALVAGDGGVRELR